MFTRSVLLALGCCVSHAFLAPVLPGCSNVAPSAGSVSTRGARHTYPLNQRADATAESAPNGSLVLIEVTKKHARVFKSVAKGSLGELVQPVDEWRVHEQSNREKRSQGQGKHHAEKVDTVADTNFLVKFYMDELSGVINAADQVLLVGHGQAKSNLAQALATALCQRHPALTDKIADVLRLDGKHITQNQLLALGRRHLLHVEDPRKPT